MKWIALAAVPGLAAVSQVQAVECIWAVSNYGEEGCGTQKQLAFANAEYECSQKGQSNCGGQCIWKSDLLECGTTLPFDPEAEDCVFKDKSQCGADATGSTGSGDGAGNSVPGFGVLEKTATEFCGAVDDLPGLTCTSTTSGFAIGVKFSLLNEDSFVKTALVVDVCPSSSTGFDPKITFDQTLFQLTTSLKTELDQPSVSRLFANDGFKIVLGKFNYPTGVGTLQTFLNAVPEVDTAGFSMNVFVDMCYMLDGTILAPVNALVNPPLGTSPVPTKARNIFNSIYGKEFCSEDMRDKLIMFYETFATIDNPVITKATDAIASFIEDMRKVQLPFKVFNKRVDIGDFCKADSISAYTDAAKAEGFKPPSTNSASRVGMVTLVFAAAPVLLHTLF